MENRVFILFFVIVFLSFLFALASCSVLHIRKKHDLKIPPFLWIMLFVSAAVPLTFGTGLIELQLFTDYTAGLRVEFHSMLFVGADEDSFLGDVYIRKQILDVIRIISLAGVMVWLSCTAALLSFGMSSYFNSLHFLTKHSSECHDDKINKIFAEALKIAKIKRNVVLRVVKSDIRISPCTCGTVFPAVFVGKDYLYGYSDTRLKLIFLHELIHIKQHHSFLKILTLVMTSLFGLIPFSRMIRNAIIEDCEYICDRCVMKVMGDDAIAEYMAMIIDVAERNVRYKNHDELLSPVSESGEMILKRYGAMKTRNKQKNSFRYILPLIAATVLLNLFCMSSITVKSIDNLGVDIASPLVEKALCEYFGVSDPHDLNQEHIASVYSIEFALSEEIEMIPRTPEKRYAVSVIINEGLVFNGTECLPLPGYPDEVRFSCGIIPQVVRTDVFERVIPQDSDERVCFAEYYHRQEYAGSENVPVVKLECPDRDILREYLLHEYERGALDVFLIRNKNVDTRDIALFGDLRTLIFSDNLKSTDENLYTDAYYAVVERK